MKTRLRQGREEQVGTCQAPDDLAFGASGYPGHEQGGRRPVDGAGSAAGALVQCPIGQSAARKPLVDLRYAERQNPSVAQTGAFQMRDLLSQAVEDGVSGDGWVHDLLRRQPVFSLRNSNMFCICSYGVNESMRM